MEALCADCEAEGEAEGEGGAGEALGEAMEEPTEEPGTQLGTRPAAEAAEAAEVAEAAEAGLRLPVLPVEIPLGPLRRLHGWCAAHREPLLTDEASVPAHGEAHALLDGIP